MAEKLTAAIIKNLELPEKGQKLYFDSEVKGFAVRCLAPSKRSPGGVRSFVLDYWHGKVQRRLTIGQFPTWTIHLAREKAKELRREIDSGSDPLDTREKLRTAPTVADLCQRYIDDHLPGKRPKSQKEDKRCITKEILPSLGKRKVADVHVGDIRALHQKITKRAPVQANRTVALLSKMFSLSLAPLAGENTAWRTPVDGNPCFKVERNEEVGRDRYFSEAELFRIAAALETHSGKPAANILKLVMLTAARPGECRLATWDQIDFEKKVWTKPASTKQKKEHAIPLAPPALLLLQTIRETAPDDCAYICPGRKTTDGWQPIGESGYNKAWAHVVREAELKPAKGFAPRVYDLRHSVASHALGLGLPIGIIGQLLGHSSDKTTQRYIHPVDDPLSMGISCLRTAPPKYSMTTKFLTIGLRHRLAVRVQKWSES